MDESMLDDSGYGTRVSQTPSVFSSASSEARVSVHDEYACIVTCKMYRGRHFMLIGSGACQEL